MAARHPTGTLRFDEFMEVALYDPEGGYYVGAEDIGGHRRDFSTIPSLSPLLGLAVAKWALALPGFGRGPLDIIEVGAGGGHLAESILAGAGWWARRRIRYRIVDKSPALKQAQRKLLDGRKVTWHSSVAEAVAAADNPVVVSNELVDAFPCRLLRFGGGIWRELRLTWPPDSAEPFQSHPVTDLDSADFSSLQPDRWPGRVIPEGQTIEIHPAYRRWLGDWARSAPRFHHLTIDYGDSVGNLYKDRLKGSLRGYFSHQRLIGGSVLQAPGRVDLTSDVNFTDLAAWGTDLGLETLDLTDQADFLAGWLPDKVKASRAEELRAIMDPEGAGGAFKVLWQAKR
jgi:SAM-dependent MidA family methyltransferase